MAKLDIEWSIDSLWNIQVFTFALQFPNVIAGAFIRIIMHNRVWNERRILRVSLNGDTRTARVLRDNSGKLINFDDAILQKYLAYHI